MDAIGVISGFKECDYLFQWARSTILSQFSGTNEQGLDEELFRLKNGLQSLRDTIHAMYELIDRAEWRSHKHYVVELLPKLRDGVYDAEDLLDEFRWYEMKVQVEGNASQSSFIDFFHTAVQGSFNKLNDVQLRLVHLSSQLEKMGLPGVTQHFDKLIRPETTSLPSETKIFGRDKELEHVLGFLNVSSNSTRKRAPSGTIAATSASQDHRHRFYIA